MRWLYRCFCLFQDSDKENLYLQAIGQRPSHAPNCIVFKNVYPEYTYEIADNLDTAGIICLDDFTDFFNSIYMYHNIDVQFMVHQKS
jgi:hypothetical protein